MVKKGRALVVLLLSLVCAGSLIAAAACTDEEPGGDDTKYAVSYSGGASDAVGTIPTEYYGAGTPITLRDIDAFEREGYSFTKWSDGTSLYDAGETYTVTKDVTFTAQWEALPPQAAPEGSETVEAIPAGALTTVNGGATANWFASYTENGLKITAWVADTTVYTGGVYESDGIEVIFANVARTNGYTDKTVSVTVAADGEKIVRNMKTGEETTVSGLETEAKYLTIDGETVAGYRISVTMPYEAAGISQEHKDGAVALALTNATKAGMANTVYDTTFDTVAEKVYTYIAVADDDTFEAGPYLHGGTWGDGGTLAAADVWNLENDDGTANAYIEMTGTSGDNFIYMRNSNLLNYYAEIQLTVTEVARLANGSYDGYPKFGVTVFSENGASGLFFYVDAADSEGENDTADGIIGSGSINLGYNLRTNGAWAGSWTTVGNLGEGATSADYQGGNYVTLGIYRQNSLFKLTLNGEVVATVTNTGIGENDGSYLGLASFNLLLKAKSYTITTDEEVLARYRAEIVEPEEPGKTLDGSLADWTAEDKSNPFVIPSTDGNSVTVYATKDESGVYIFYDVYHSVHKAGETDWFNNTNVEFRLAGDANKQYAIAANGFKANLEYAYMYTEEPAEEGGLYHTVAEIFVPYSELGTYTAASESVPAQFYFKIGGVYGNPWFTGDWWRTDDGNAAQGVLITENGIKSGAKKTVDGSDADWTDADWTETNRSRWAASLEEDGLYIIVKLSQENISADRAFVSGADGSEGGAMWWLNQNVEIQATANVRSAKVIWMNGEAYYTGYINDAAAVYTHSEDGNDTLVFEIFIARENLIGVTDSTKSIVLSFGGQLFSDAESMGNMWEVYAANATVRVPSYIATYEDGDSVQSVYVAKGESIGTLPAENTPAGYTFEGWFVGDTKIDADYVPAANVTVTAKYSPIPPVITVSAGDATLKEGATAPSVTPEWNEGGGNYTIVLPEECPYEKEGYSFDKWVVVIEGVSGSAQYESGATVTLGCDTKATISMNWIATGSTYYTVTFALGYEGAPEYSETRSVEEGESISAESMPTDPVREGYRFDGWYADEVEFTAETAVESSLTVTAKWVKQVTVTFELGYETTVSAPEAITVDAGSTVTPPAAPTRGTYFLFGGWFSGETELTSQLQLEEDLTVTARWTLDSEKQTEINYLFIGASTISTGFWYTYGGTFGDANKSVNLAVPGWKVENVIDLVNSDDLLQYNPKEIVMHIGLNNVNDAQESDEKVIERLSELFNTLKSFYPEAKLYYVSIIRNVAFSQNTETYQSINNWAKEQEGITFIDVDRHITMTNGVADMQWFASDGLHPSVEGYAVFHREIATALNLEYTTTGNGLGDTAVEGAPAYLSTAGWVYDAESGIWHNNDVGKSGINKLMISGAYGATLYAEAQVSVAGMYQGETGGKAGIAISSGTATYFFYINLSTAANSDGLWDDNYGSLAYRVEKQGQKDWVYPETLLADGSYFRPFGGNGYVGLGSQAYDHNVNAEAYKTLGVAKYGTVLYFFASGNLIGKVDSLFGADEAVAVSVYNFNTNMYAKAGTASVGEDGVNRVLAPYTSLKTLDGSLADWTETEKSNSVVIAATDNRSVTVYAIKDARGVNVFYDVWHSVYKTTEDTWFYNTNVEFRLGGGETQFYASSNGASNGLTDYCFKTEYDDDVQMYHSVFEGYIAYSAITGYSADSDYIPGAFCWKTTGEKGAICYVNEDWWRTDDPTVVRPALITANGILKISATEKTIDGSDSDWSGATFTTSTGTTDGASADYAMYLGENGLYGIIRISSEGINVTKADTTGWHLNTNLEFFTGTDVTNYTGRIVTFGGELYYTGCIDEAAMTLSDDGNTLTIEFFIANEHMKNVTSNTESAVIDFGGQLYSTGVGTDTWQNYARSVTVTRSASDSQD